MRPSRVLFIDIETQSAAKISNVLEYVNHPSTRLACAVARIDGVEIRWAPVCPYDINSVNRSKVCPFPTDIPWVAHNAFGFDALVWDRLYPDHKPTRWIDTAPMARAAGFPGGLDKLSKEMFGEGKLEAGQQLIETMCTAKYKANGLTYTIGTPRLWEMFLDYNAKDVELLERVYNALAPRFTEWELLDIDREVNSRGIAFDPKLLTSIHREWNRVQASAFDEITALTDGKLSGSDLRSTAKVKSFLESRGLDFATLNKQQFTETLLDDIEQHDAIAAEVLRARQTVTRGSKGKVDRLLSILAVSGNRLRHSLNFHGACPTGRWSGRGLQPQNLARATDAARLDRILNEFDETGTLTLGENPADVLTELMRPVFCATGDNVLGIGDYAQIEARMLAWLAGESSQLDAFANERDVYREMAGKLFGVEPDAVTKPQRQLGKVIVLGCGYGMGHAKLELFCKLSKPHIDLAALGLTAKGALDTYRKSVPRITKFWRDLNDLSLATVKHKTKATLGRIGLYYASGDFVIELPSGRCMVYRKIQVEDLEPAYVKLYGMTPFTQPTLTYSHPHGFRKILYGGLLAENISQGASRDVLADALLRNRRGSNLDVVLHVHDEIITEGPRGHSEVLTQLMGQRPSWADGFPLKSEIHESRRYSK